MRHLTKADYTRQPWKNGKGETIELARAERDGALLWRLSMATVSEDGPFSIFPEIERNLTVLTGPGFRLSGPDLALDCRPLCPVAFPGDIAVQATGTGGHISTDFNVMTARRLPRPDVAVRRGPVDLPAGDLIGLFALEPAKIGDRTLGRHDLILTEGPIRLSSGAALAIRFHGLA